MAAHLLVYQCCYWEAVEAVCEGPPQPDVVPPFALVVEAVDAVDGGTLVVASQQEEILRVLDLQERSQDTLSKMASLLQVCIERVVAEHESSARGMPPSRSNHVDPTSPTLKASSKHIVSRLCLPRST
jgi:hypothetical protein